MVLEALINPDVAERKWWLDFLIGFGYATLGLFVANIVFKDSASLVMVFFTTMAALPLFYRTLKYEEAKDLVAKSESGMLKEHAKAIFFFLLLFLGMGVAFAFWYVVLPAASAASAFSVQAQTISSINRSVTGAFARMDLFSKIFLNNVEVLFFCILFSLLYGAGSLFILTWNASVIGVALGNFVRGALGTGTVAGGSVLTAYMTAVSGSALRYLIHGIPEIVGYLIAALAGGIISMAIINHDFRTKNFEKLVLDATDLVMIAIGFLFVAACIEVYVTPLMF